MEIVQTSLVASLTFWAIVLLPLAVFAVAVHYLEHFIQSRLATRFGWRSVLVTGWLGTPIHELSHAAMCLLFRHRIDEIQLFDPDVKEGRLGFVRHSYRRGNLFEEAGNVFIGTAPLIGGSIVLLGLTLLFYQSAMTAIFSAVQATSADPDAGAAVKAVLGSLAAQFSVSSLSQPRFWIFAYLITCVGAHMAPSHSDYHGAMRGAILVGSLLFAATVVIVAAFRLDSNKLAENVLTLFAPLLAISAVALGLVAASAVFVWLLTMIFPVRYVQRSS